MNRAMNCAEAEPLLNAYLDRELDLAGSLTLERHLSECRACAAQYEGLENLRREIADAGLRYVPQRGLERRIGSLIGARQRSEWRWLAGAAAAGAMAAALMLLMIPLRSNRPFEDAAILDSHLRSLMPGHLVDVPSSDRHTVKPWFQGKTSFSPPVPDLTDKGYVLTGGRLDVIGQHPAAALIYKRREHIINLYVSGEAHGEFSSKPSLREINGYRLVQWTDGGLRYSAISDLNEAELRAFAELLRAH